ncbi:hypothetical protein K435DRAFT_802493 [Dendrothele bispora CBS 962.96]|uniref:TM7S3/TM198-like domain-containing protein n=1 Tax=Dendrothele bispora (strain CBS 962.96) TaxID=1314807 RepID=A0A4S8LKT0_DENBC|nr:hypothetical protein K435DRAFT_802493 [Dendrothele bispora CBS 962.96]
MTAAVLLRLLFCQFIAHVSSVRSLSIPSSDTTALLHTHTLVPRQIEINTLPNGTYIVSDPATQQIIAQGPATDGSGSNFSAPALIWIGYTLAFGLPLTIAGIRGWRFTLGASLALTAAVCSWAAIISTVNETGVSDILLTIIVLAFSFLGFIMGFFEFARVGATGILGILGGLAFGIRIILLKEGLLLSSSGMFFLNWIIIAVFGVGGGSLVVWRQRAGLLTACASTGTFLTVLGADLILHKQSGLSRGLRFLFDRNSSHIADILQNGYHPTLATVILLGASLGAIPIVAYAQHRIFKQPFRRIPEESDVELAIDDPTTKLRMFSPEMSDRRTTFFSRAISRFSM